MGPQHGPWEGMDTGGPARTISLADGSSVPGWTAAGLSHTSSQPFSLPLSEVDGILGWMPERLTEGRRRSPNNTGEEEGPQRAGKWVQKWKWEGSSVKRHAS